MSEPSRQFDHRSGRILIRRDGFGKAVFDNHRLTDIAPALCARPAREAPRLARLLLPVCGWAQGLACVTAIETAAGRPAAAPTLAARALLAEAEMATRLLWHAAIDWPPLLGQPVQPAALRLVATGLEAMAAQLWRMADPLAPGDGAAPLEAAAEPARCLAEAVENMVLTGAPANLEDAGAWADWVENSEAALARLARRARSLAIPAGAPDAPLPPLAALAGHLDADAGFGRAPHVLGRAADATAAGRSGAARALGAYLGPVAARFLDTAISARALAIRLSARTPRAVEAVRLPGGAGAALVFTLRGPLVHLAALDGPDPSRARLVRFRAVAPTEWMLHPEGALARALSALLTPDFAAAARLVVAAFDPCAVIEVRAAREDCHA